MTLDQNVIAKSPEETEKMDLSFKHHVLIGLGSNLHQPLEQIKIAVNEISNHPEIKIIKLSSLYQSSPQGPQDQDDFINAVLYISTNLNPHKLLSFLQQIEKAQGRIKLRHWGERCIDLDILFIDQLTLKIDDPDLEIPHPYALKRDFVLIPSLEVCPTWTLPDGSSLNSYADNCETHNLTKIDNNLT